MSTGDPLDRRLLLGDGVPGHDASEDDGPDEVPPPPPVVVVLVAEADAPEVGATLDSLAAQDYPGLRVLVVDSGDGAGLGERVRDTLPDAAVHRVRAFGFAEAANACTAVPEVPAFWCFVRDDVVLAPDAVRILVEEAYRSNAGVVGPKIVDRADPERLVDVGRAIDRFGGAHTGIEPGELDQEQHDAVRDVFFVSEAVMLVRTDLFTALGGFDPEADPGSADLDLCWRARIAGARVMVVPDARIAQWVVPFAERRPAEVRERARRRVRTVFTCYSGATLAWIVPLGLIGSALEALAFLFSRRRAEGIADARAWWWSLLHLRQVRRSRRRAQALRSVPDSALRELQIGWSARLGSFLAHHHADERVESMGDRLRSTSDQIFDALRHPGTVLFGCYVAVLAFATRALWSQGLPAVGDLVPWTTAGPMFDAYGSAWRHTGLGAARSASGALGAMATLTLALFDHPGLARTVLVALVVLLGPLGVSRLVRRLGAARGPAMTAAILYGISPVVRNAVAGGRLGPLVLFVCAPYIVLSLIRASGFAGVEERGSRRRALLALAVATALATAFFPPAALFVVLAALALFVGSLCVGRDVVAGLRALAVAVAGIVAGGVLLLPWITSVTALRDDPGAFGLDQYLARIGFTDVLRMHTGPAGAGSTSWGFYVVAAFGLLVATGPRFAWVARAWMLAAVGVAAVFVPAQVWPEQLVPAPEGALTATALGLAVAAGLAVGAFTDDLRRARFGWRQLASLVAAAGLAFAAVGYLADAAGGRWHAPRQGWDASLSFTTDRLFAGDFRVLWIGDPAVLPTDPFEVRPGIAYTVTLDGAGDAREVVRAPAGAGDAALRRAVGLALDGRTNRLGRLVGPMGIRYVAVPARNGPGGVPGRPIPGLRTRIADQLDLAELQAARGLRLYENAAWIPVAAFVESRADVPTGAADPIRSAVDLDLSADARPLGDVPVGPGTVLLAENHDRHWVASAGRTLAHGVGVGWDNAWALRSESVVDVRYDAQTPSTVMVVGQGLLWAVVLVVAWRGRRRWLVLAAPTGPTDRAEERDEARRRRRARDESRDRIRRDELDDDFWSTR